MSLYRLDLWLPSESFRGATLAASYLAPNLAAAERRAEELLEPHRRIETDYSARWGRAAEVEVSELGRPRARAGKRHGRRSSRPRGALRLTIEAETVIVPSVGDLGWTP